MDARDIPYLSVADLSELIQKKEVSTVEVVQAYLDRIDQLNPKLNAYLTVCQEDALRAAHQADSELAHGEYRGAMHGIPVAVKDQLYTKGVRTTGGTPIFSDYVPEEDATVITKLKEAGSVLLGKLNMTEFATTGYSHGFDTARNPWDLERYTGGSSSGSGAATAGFLCATSLGEDTGGSIRFPAAWCGLVGLRPTWGRVSRYGLMTGVWSMDTIGPISRTVEDCAITLEAIAGHDPKDEHTSKSPVPNYREALGGDIKDLKVGLVTEIMDLPAAHPEVKQAVEGAAGVLAELGASVDMVSIPLSKHSQTISGSIRVEAPMTHWELVKNRLQEIRHDNRIGYLVGSILPAQAYYKAQKLRTLLREQVLEALNRFDVLVMPTTGTAAQLVQPDPVIDNKDKANRTSTLLTTTFSLASVPAMSIPCGFTSEGLPIALQLGSGPFKEELLLKVAYAYEQSTPWHTKVPPL